MPDPGSGIHAQRNPSSTLSLETGVMAASIDCLGDAVRWDLAQELVEPADKENDSVPYTQGGSGADNAVTRYSVGMRCVVFT